MFQLFALVLCNADKSTVRPFIPCSARHFKKGAKFAGSVGHPMTKLLSASGGLRPPDQGLCPWTPLGALPPDPRYRLVLCARHGAPQLLLPPMILVPRAPPTYFNKFTPMSKRQVSGSDISWAICKSAPSSRQITMPAPHHSVFFTGRMPFLPPKQQRQSTG